MPPELSDVVRLRIVKAEHDLEAARRIMAVPEGCPYDTVYFHCQQAVEKYLKALLTPRDFRSPYARSRGAAETLAVELDDAHRAFAVPQQVRRDVLALLPEESNPLFQT